MANNEAEVADPFLTHLKTLEKNKAEVEAVHRDLLARKTALQLRLLQTKDERNQAGVSGMKSLSEEAALESRKYKQRLRRSNLEHRLITALQDELRIRDETLCHIDNEQRIGLQQLLRQTRDQLNNATSHFEKCAVDVDQSTAEALTHFEVERARSTLALLKQELIQVQTSLDTAQSNESKLIQKHDAERYKNEAEGIF